MTLLIRWRLLFVVTLLSLDLLDHFIFVRELTGTSADEPIDLGLVLVELRALIVLLTVALWILGKRRLVREPQIASLSFATASFVVSLVHIHAYPG